MAVAVGISEPRHPLMFNTECVVWPSARRLACLRQAKGRVQLKILVVFTPPLVKMCKYLLLRSQGP